MRTPLLTVIMITSLQALVGPNAHTLAAESVNMTFDLTATGKTITNKFSDINVWSIGRMWTDESAGWPRDHFSGTFPFVRRVQLMAATGGNPRRDLFLDPNDRSTLTDYDFEPLIRACRNILAMGLKPMIKTGWVPLKLSAQPKTSSFRTNVRPPEDYDAYYAYLKAVAEALQGEFGVAEVRTWTWCVGVEYDNRDWFEAEDGQPETTRAAFFKLYDYSVAALEDVLGPEHLTVGAHGMAPGGWGLWDMADLLDHCAKGTNAKRAGRGTQLDFLTFSYYTKTPGFNPGKFVADIDRLRSRARQAGFHHLWFGVDEGRVLNGWDGKVIYGREVQHPVQAAGDAKLFHLMVDRNVDYFSTWRLTTQGLRGGLPLASANLRNLTYRMTGSALVEARPSGQPTHDGNDVGGLAGYDAATQTLRVLLYNFNPDRDAAGSEDVSLTLTGVRTGHGGALTLRRWLLDEDHGNWWKAWQADVAARKMTAESFKHSQWTVALPGDLADPADVTFWRSRVADYAEAARLTPVDQSFSLDPHGGVRWRTRLRANAVVLYELSPVEPAPSTQPSQ